MSTTTATATETILSTDTTEREAIAWAVNFTLADAKRNLVRAEDWQQHLGSDSCGGRRFFTCLMHTCAA